MYTILDKSLASVIALIMGVAYWFALNIFASLIIGVFLIAKGLLGALVNNWALHEYKDSIFYWYIELVVSFDKMLSSAGRNVIELIGLDGVLFSLQVAFFLLTVFILHRLIWDISLSVANVITSSFEGLNYSYLREKRKLLTNKGALDSVGLVEYAYFWSLLFCFFIWWNSIQLVTIEFFENKGTLKIRDLILSIGYEGFIQAYTSGLILGLLTIFLLGRIFFVFSQNIPLLFSALSVMYYQYPLLSQLDMNFPKGAINSIEGVLAVGFIYYILNIVILVVSPFVASAIYYLLYGISGARQYLLKSNSYKLEQERFLDYLYSKLRFRNSLFMNEFIRYYFLLLVLWIIELVTLKTSYSTIAVFAIIAFTDIVRMVKLKYVFSGYSVFVNTSKGVMAVSSRIGRLYAHPIKDRKLKRYDLVKAQMIKNKIMNTSRLKGIPIETKLDNLHIRITRLR